MKYKLYIASYALTTKRETGHDEWTVISRNIPEDKYDEITCATQDEAETLCAECDGLISFKRPKTVISTKIHTAYEPFDTHRDAESWLDANRDAAEADKKTVTFASIVREMIIDTEELVEFKPVYEVELEVVITKRMYVTVDSSEHDDINDEYDARGWACDQVQDGEMDGELECAETENVEADSVGCEEQ